MFEGGLNVGLWAEPVLGVASVRVVFSVVNSMLARPLRVISLAESADPGVPPLSLNDRRGLLGGVDGGLL